jgi:hypothetical protein
MADRRLPTAELGRSRLSDPAGPLERHAALGIDDGGARR